MSKIVSAESLRRMLVEEKESTEVDAATWSAPAPQSAAVPSHPSMTARHLMSPRSATAAVATPRSPAGPFSGSPPRPLNKPTSPMKIDTRLSSSKPPLSPSSGIVIGQSKTFQSGSLFGGASGVANLATSPTAQMTIGYKKPPNVSEPSIYHIPLH